MASAQASDKFLCNNKCYAYYIDPADLTVATDVAWVDMSAYGEFTVICMTTVLGSTGITALSIVANVDATGTPGTDRIIKTHAVGSLPNAIGDFLVLSCTAEEIAQIGKDNSEDLRYVTAIVTGAHADATAAVVYIRSKPTFASDGLTADYVS